MSAEVPTSAFNDLAYLVEKLSVCDTEIRIISSLCTCKIPKESDTVCTYCTEFFQPPPPDPECPICCMPLSFGRETGKYFICCGKRMCLSCVFAEDIAMMETGGQQKGIFGQRRLPMRCPFCRALCFVSSDEKEKRLKKRMDANDPSAYDMNSRSALRTGDLLKVAELTTKAIERGSLGSYAILAVLLRELLRYLGQQGDGNSSERIRVSMKGWLEIGAKKGSIDCHHQLGEIQLEDANPGPF